MPPRELRRRPAADMKLASGLLCCLCFLGSCGTLQPGAAQSGGWRRHSRLAPSLPAPHLPPLPAQLARGGTGETGALPSRPRVCILGCSGPPPLPSPGPVCGSGDRDQADDDDDDFRGRGGALGPLRSAVAPGPGRGGWERPVPPARGAAPQPGRGQSRAGRCPPSPPALKRSPLPTSSLLSAPAAGGARN